MTLDHQYTAFSAMRMKKSNAPIKQRLLSQSDRSWFYLMRDYFQSEYLHY